MTTHGQPVPGTTIFDAEQAMKGYAVNKMRVSFNDAANRAEFLRDEDAYRARYGLSPAQRAAVRHRNVLELIWWLTARAILGAGSGGEDVGIREVAATYHVPISNTAAGMMLLEPAG